VEDAMPHAAFRKGAVFVAKLPNSEKIWNMITHDLILQVVSKISGSVSPGLVEN